MRTAEIKRKTKETDISLKLTLEGGERKIDTGIGFFDHMLNSFAVHSGFGLTLTCKGDLEVDGHHSVEDCGIALGQALAQCVGDKAGIARFGQAFVPMDEALGFCALDISGRPYLVFDAPMPQPMCGQYDTCLTVEFMRALAVHAGLTLHLKCEYGENAHHITEALFTLHARSEALLPAAVFLARRAFSTVCCNGEWRRRMENEGCSQNFIKSWCEPLRQDFIPPCGTDSERYNMSYIAIVDYGAGNLMSVHNTLDYLGYENKIAASADVIENAAGVILPGVGAFPDAMAALEHSGLTEAVLKAAKEKPFLGICLGMQMLFEESDEVRPCRGLGLLPGRIERIETVLKLPQIGWNALDILRPNAMTEGLENGSYVYFVHSFMAHPADENDLAAVTDYGTRVPAMVARGNLFGCQFHPEKSGEVGLAMLRNFAKLTEVGK